MAGVMENLKSHPLRVDSKKHCIYIDSM